MGTKTSKLEAPESQPQPHLQHDADKQASPLMGTSQTEIQTQTQTEAVRQQISLKKPPPPSSSSSSSLLHLHHNLEPSVIKPKSSLPSNIQDILKDDDSPSNLFAAVFSHDKTMKYWVDKKSNCNCFMLYAKALSIVWSSYPQYWKWELLEEARGKMIEVAELKGVSWLEITGRIDTRKLTPGIVYEVSFHVMMKDSAYGWKVPVTLRLELPGGKKQEHKESLEDKIRERWMDIPAGQFVASGKDDDGGDMEVTMDGHVGGLWKHGLVVKGVIIKPTSEYFS